MSSIVAGAAQKTTIFGIVSMTMKIKPTSSRKITIVTTAYLRWSMTISLTTSTKSTTATWAEAESLSPNQSPLAIRPRFMRLQSIAKASTILNSTSHPSSAKQRSSERKRAFADQPFCSLGSRKLRVTLRIISLMVLWSSTRKIQSSRNIYCQGITYSMLKLIPLVTHTNYLKVQLLTSIPKILHLWLQSQERSIPPSRVMLSSIMACTTKKISTTKERSGFLGSFYSKKEGLPTSQWAMQPIATKRSPLNSAKSNCLLMQRLQQLSLQVEKTSERSGQRAIFTNIARNEPDNIGTHNQRLAGQIRPFPSQAGYQTGASTLILIKSSIIIYWNTGFKPD